MNDIKEQINNISLIYQFNYTKVVNSINNNFKNKQLKNEILTITSWLNKYNKISLKERIFCILNNIDHKPLCKNCNNVVSFSKDKYKDFCGGKCVGQYNRKKISNSNKLRYQIDGEDINKKRQSTCIEKYGVNNVAQLDTVQLKMKLTRKLKTGYEHSLQNPKSRLKYIKTCIEKYGVENASQSNVIKQKKMNTMLKNYNCKHYLQNPENKKKVDSIILQRYGVTNIGMLSKRTYSKISQKIFWNIYNELPNNIKNKTYFAELNKEFDIFAGSRKQYMYDFVISNLKICIEFNGDIWHANPYYYDANEKHPIKNMLNKDIWKNDIDKYCELIKRGYSIFIIWESDYRLNGKKIENKIINYIQSNIKIGG